MKPETCPDRQTLEKLLLGDLPAAERESLAEHLLYCDACVGTAETITVGDDLTEALRTRRVMAADQSAIQEVIERAKQLRATGETVEVDETIVTRALPQPADIESLKHEEEITFLAPAEQADELGWLGGYRVLEVLGVGGMGIVFRAEDPQLKRQVALKAMKPAVATSRSAKDRFLREARATAAIEHDNIVHIYQVGEDLGVPFIAMQFLRGESLQDRLVRESRLSPAEVVKIGREMADGLEAAHRQDLVHRDIKPDNIWLEEGSGRVKIVDFGLVRSADSDAGLTQAGMVLGTPRYMAPEQAQGQVVDHRCDLFSLGSVLYRIASGKSPFEGSNITATLIAVAQATPKPVVEIHKEIDPDLAALIMRLLSKDRDARPQTAAEVSQQLADIGRKIDTSDGVSSPGPTDAVAATASFPIRPIAENLPTIVKQPARRTIPRPSKKAGASGGNNRTKLIAAGLGGALVLLAAIVFFVRIGKYDVQITLDDPSMSLKVDGEAVLIEGNGEPIRLSAGEHTLHVEMNGFESDTDRFTVKKDGKNAVHVARLDGKLKIVADGKPAVPSNTVASTAKTNAGSPGSERVLSATGSPSTPPLPIAPFDARQARAHQEAWAKYLGTTVETTNSVGAKMILIPPGEFLMGSSDEQLAQLAAIVNERGGDNKKWLIDFSQKNEVPQHRVVLTKPILLAATEVTVGQFKRFVEATGYLTGTKLDDKANPDEKGKDWRNPGYAVTDELPVSQVSWNDANAYCAWLSREENVEYRLPTEAEWEFACRAGTTTQFSFGDDEAKVSEYGWYHSISGGSPRPVATKLPNAFGLFDMLGNLEEVCGDGYEATAYSNRTGLVVNPAGPLTGYVHAQRGCSWRHAPFELRSAMRYPGGSTNRYDAIGFRVARTVGGTLPPLAVAPFDAATAKKHQQTWAKHLGTAVETTNSIGAKMILIPPGEFLMGSTDEQIEAVLRRAGKSPSKGLDILEKRLASERPQHRVVLTRPLAMGATEVTIGQFRQFVEDSNYVTDSERIGYGNASSGTRPETVTPEMRKATWRTPGYAVTDDSPVAQVTWNDAIAFCRWLSAHENLDSSYEGTDDKWMIRYGNGYRLPTEAEWEFACRAGTTTQFYFGDDADQLEQFAWCRKNSGGATHSVAAKLPNSFGLFDMYGNASEWCQDVDHSRAYDIAPFANPLFDTGGYNRVLRGGHAPDEESTFRNAARNQYPPTGRSPHFGFRVVRQLDITATGASVTPQPTVPDTAPGKITDINDPAFQKWMKNVASLSIAKQVEAVAKKLVELNPGFDGKLKPTIRNDYVTELRLNGAAIADISPLAAWQKMPLTLLDISQTKVSDLSPIKDFKLTSFACIGTKVLSLVSLQNMPLTELYCQQTLVSDLSPIKGMPLTLLYINNTKVSDLSALSDMPLEELGLDFQPERDTELLRSIKTLKIINFKPAAEFWKEVE